MSRWIGMLTVLLAASLLLAGCGKKQQSGGGGPPTGVTGITGAGPPGKLVGGKVAVNIADLKFEPEQLSVPAGATVLWLNMDNVPHTVKKEKGPGPEFDSGPIETGAAYSQTLKREGTYHIVDPDRPTTEMEIKVVKGLVEEE